jgi:hypothetical protein
MIGLFASRMNSLLTASVVHELDPGYQTRSKARMVGSLARVGPRGTNIFLRP